MIFNTFLSLQILHPFQPEGGVMEGQIMHVPFRPAVIQPMMLVTPQPQNYTTTTTSE